jgi:lycopene beta-cyclase
MKCFAMGLPRRGVVQATSDILIIGAGPMGMALAAAMSQQGLRVAGLAPMPADTPWVNTYGVWVDQIAPLGLAEMLSHRWQDTVAYAGGQRVALQREYGLLDNQRLQQYLLQEGARGGVAWQQGSAVAVRHDSQGSWVRTQAGQEIHTRVVIDASGHRPALLQRPAAVGMAYQAAYGIVGHFSAPPVPGNQLVLMDFRSDHLRPEQLREPPTFVYAMNLGGGRYFVEETSLAYAPGVSLKILEQRLHQRLNHAGIHVTAIEHVERCFFPMNPPLPSIGQRVVGYGAAASLVHPPSGYMVGQSLRYAMRMATAVAHALGQPAASPAATANAAWQVIWPRERIQRRALYLFGLASLMRCSEAQTQDFFRTFFAMPYTSWSRYLTDDLSTPELLQVMLHLFGRLPNTVRLTLARSVGQEHRLLLAALAG